MSEVMKMEVRQSNAVTSHIKVVPYIIPPIPRCIVEHPRHVEPSP